MWYIYTREYYSVTKRNEILSFAETWMDLEGIMLSEISQRKTAMISLICGIQKTNKHNKIERVIDTDNS